MPMKILQGQSAYPNNGRDLHRAALKFANTENVVALSELATPRRLRMNLLDQKDSYLVAGSFVRYLVETYGMEKFRRLYRFTPLEPGSRRSGGVPSRWRDIYGKSIGNLATEWSRAIRA